jgi:hypothetical protein
MKILFTLHLHLNRRTLPPDFRHEVLRSLVMEPQRRAERARDAVARLSALDPRRQENAGGACSSRVKNCSLGRAGIA